MRISHSSSLLLATLAISSSSSSLAAPTEPGSLDPTVFSSSSSIRSLAMMGRDDSVSFNFHGGDQRSNAGDTPTADMYMHHDRRGLDLVGLLNGLPAVGHILGPLLSQILDLLGLQGKSGASAESMPDITPDQLSTVAELLAKASGQLHATVGNSVGAVTGAVNGVAGTVDGVAGAVSSAVHKRDAQNSSASVSKSFTSTASTASSIAGSSTSLEAMALPTPSGTPNLPMPGLPVNPPVGKNGTGPTSPALPVNPPNSPVAVPAGAPRPPVPAGVSLPSAPIPRDAPPMFPAYKAADVSSSSAVVESSTSASFGSASSDPARTPTMTASQSSVTMSQSASASASSGPASA